MTILLAPDSFKESLNAKEVCDSMEKGIKKFDPAIECIKVPMADGGEGTMQSLVDATGGKVFKVDVLDPLGRPIVAEYGILGDKETAVFEMATASGLHLLKNHERNPLITTTYGTGQVISACLEHPIKKLLIGIGGSATNDAGAGMLVALGGNILNKDGISVNPCGGDLNQIETIDLTLLDPRLKYVEIEVACDVENRLTGAEGASNIFGPQKGATPEMVKILDNNLLHFSKVIDKKFNTKINELAGGGAAGGLGASLSVFLNAELRRGVEMVLEYTKLEDYIKDVDIVWTGEGSMDSQTVYGKTPFGVANLATKYNIPVIGIAGSLGKGAEVLYNHGFNSLFSIVNGAVTLDEALKHARENLEVTSENIVRLLSIGGFNN